MTEPHGLGLSWSVTKLKGGGQLGNWVFKCVRCEREQSYAPAEQPGGIDESEARKIGWLTTSGAWVCPFCNPRPEE